MTFDTMTRPQLEAELRRCNDVMMADGEAIGALKETVEELHQQDRLKTREINTLVPENRDLIKQRDELRAALACLTTSPRFASMAVSQAVAELRDNGCWPVDCPLDGDVRCILAKTAPVNPNSGVVQVSPRGRWTP